MENRDQRVYAATIIHDCLPVRGALIFRPSRSYEHEADDQRASLAPGRSRTGRMTDVVRSGNLSCGIRMIAGSGQSGLIPALHLPPAEERGPYRRSTADLMSDYPVEFKGFKEFKGFREFAPMREQIL
jgi:hypothetical protein